MKIGTDIIEISRILNNLENSAFLDRIYTQKEKEYILSKGAGKAETAAGIFCAKEAVIKAIGTGFIGKIKLKDIQITHDNYGAPQVIIKNIDYEYKIVISISHCKQYATATAIICED